MYMHPSRHFPLWPARKMVFFESFICQAFSLKLAGYCPRSFFRIRTVGNYPAMLNGPAWKETKGNETCLTDVLTIWLRKKFELFINFLFVCVWKIRSKDQAVIEFFFFLFCQRKVGHTTVIGLRETLSMVATGQEMVISGEKMFKVRIKSRRIILSQEKLMPWRKSGKIEII